MLPLVLQGLCYVSIHAPREGCDLWISEVVVSS